MAGIPRKPERDANKLFVGKNNNKEYKYRNSRAEQHSAEFVQMVPKSHFASHRILFVLVYLVVGGLFNLVLDAFYSILEATDTLAYPFHKFRDLLTTEK